MPASSLFSLKPTIRNVPYFCKDLLFLFIGKEVNVLINREVKKTGFV
jgi:hypothetical protein